MTMQDLQFKHPTAYDWSASFQRELPFDVAVDVSYVGRMGLHLQRERNINQLLPGTLQANPGVNVNALRPYTGFGVIRLSENAGRSIYHGLQVSVERRLLCFALFWHALDIIWVWLFTVVYLMGVRP